jgi:hypothetical protein
MPAQRIEGGKATLELLPNGILHLRWDTACTITAGDAHAVLHLTDTLVGTESHPLLVDMETTKTVTREARQIFVAPSTNSRVALLGSSPVDRMIANFFFGFNRPPIPTQFFTSREQAVAWLQSEDNEHPDKA